MRTVFAHICVWTLVYLNPAFGQVKLSGPVSVEAGEVAKISLAGAENLKDLKIQCFPANDKWAAVRLIDNSICIWFVTKVEGTYCFAVAGNLADKTSLDVHQINVGKAGPQPQPSPEGGKYTSRLRPLYLVYPDNANLIKLIKVYQDVALLADRLESYKHLADALAVATKDITGLQTVRDEIALILQTDLGNRNAPIDVAKTKAIFTELVKSLTPLKD